MIFSVLITENNSSETEKMAAKYNTKEGPEIVRNRLRKQHNRLVVKAIYNKLLRKKTLCLKQKRML